jgi:hypothetical protein
MTATPSAQSRVTVLMSGLESPRGLAIGPEGALYVVEAGRGGAGPCTLIRGAMMCFGTTGALTRLWRGRIEHVVSGLPSYIAPTGEVTGPHDVSFLYRGGAYLTIGLGNGDGNPNNVRTSFGSGAALFGMLLWVSADGDTRAVADIAAHEFANNPAGGPIDTNPFGILAEDDARIVADAGANALLRVENSGRISTLAVFPSAPVRAMDAVPTAAVRGPDGAYYVGELTGVPFIAGAARVYRVVSGSPPQIFAEGFKTIIDLAFGPDGSLYVLEHASGPMFFAGPGDIIRIARDGSRSVIFQGLDRPTSLVVDGRGTLYVTNHGLSSGSGEVLRIER